MRRRKRAPQRGTAPLHGKSFAMPRDRISALPRFGFQRANLGGPTPSGAIAAPLLLQRGQRGPRARRIAPAEGGKGAALSWARSPLSRRRRVILSRAMVTRPCSPLIRCERYAQSKANEFQLIFVEAALVRRPESLDILRVFDRH